MTRRAVLLLVAVAIMVASCGDGESAGTTQADVATTSTSTTVAEAPTPSAASIHAVPAGSVVVWGTAVCDGSPDAGVDPDGGPGWLMVCEFDMSDPRVSGTETVDRFRYVAGRLWAPGVWVAYDAELTNDGGTWRGIAQAAEDDGSIPIGEAHYVGEGVYQGLEFHYYFFDSPLYEAVQIHGWISSAG